MSFIPMHNRFVEGFVEPNSSGDTIDTLSSRILPGHPGIDSETLRRDARAILSAFWAALRPLARFDAWRERRNAAKELCALDDRGLAELGLSRAEIPFVIVRPVAQRDQRSPRRAAPGNDNRGVAAERAILPIYIVK
jgi:uncharacterized protein YjiS (DUF1127 family)